MILLAHASALSAPSLLEGFVGVIVGAVIGVLGGMRIEKQRDRNEREAERERDQVQLAGAARELADRVKDRCDTLQTIVSSWTPEATLRLDADDQLQVLAQHNPDTWKIAREALTSLENVRVHKDQDFAADDASSQQLIGLALGRLRAAEIALRSILEPSAAEGARAEVLETPAIRQ